MHIKFFYKNNQYSHNHEVVITSFANAISKVIELPDTLEVCLYPLEENVYGGIDKIRVNRIGINFKIPLEDIPKVLTHELIHVHQKHKGKFKVTHDGTCYWHGIPHTKKSPDEMTYDEYRNLPWEVDVEKKQQSVLEEALKQFG